LSNDAILERRLARRPLAGLLGVVDRLVRGRATIPLLLLAPLVLFLAGFFVMPVATMIWYSFHLQTAQGTLEPGLTLANYLRLLDVDLYRRVLMTTLRVSVLTAVIAAVLAYPVAIVMARGRPWVSRAIAAIVVAPLLINVVIRTYGWRVFLANGRTGVLNWSLDSLGLIAAPLRLLYTEWAIVIGSVHVFLPMMVLPIAAALGRIDPAIDEAARTLGARAWDVFRHVTVPLTLPGLAVGTTLVFSLTASSFVTPAILGGNFAKMLGTLVEEQIMSIFDWPFGAAIATVMIVIVMAVNLAYIALVERRARWRAAVA
jgi:putative spermidine/putrescine transport system permease protein